MAVDKKKLEHLKHRVEKFREKHKNEGKQAKGVSRPRKHNKQPKAVGPRGGVYKPTRSGSKEYTKSLVKGIVKEVIMKEREEELKNFIKEKKMKKEEIAKAVNSDAAVPEKKADDATLNGTNAPTEPAKTPAELAAKPAETPAPAAAAPATEPAAPAKKEISFDGLFAKDYSLGAQLKQNPNGGNIMTNMKKPTIDYVERAKNHKNVSLSADELEKLRSNKK